MMLAAPSQVTGVDEMTRQTGASVNCSSPVVVVSSEYVPSALAVNVPVTCSDPVTGADGQPAPTSDRSRSPLTFRHDDVTVQVPTTLPPQAVTLGQDAPPPPPLPAARRSRAAGASARARRSAGFGLHPPENHSDRERKRQRSCPYPHEGTIAVASVTLLTNPAAPPMAPALRQGSRGASRCHGQKITLTKNPSVRANQSAGPALRLEPRCRLAPHLRLSKNFQMLALAVDETVWVQLPVQ